MSLFARARKHIDMDRVKELREEKVRKIKNERIAEIRKQQEEILVEIKKIEEKEDTRYSDWRKELKEGMTTAGLGMINLPAELDNALETSPNTSLSDSNLIISYAEGGGIAARNIRLKTVDASNYDTIQFTVTGSFNSFTSPPNSKGETYALSDRLSIGVKVGGTYVGNRLRTAFGSGTHTISIPKRFQKPNMRFDIFQQTVKQGVSGIIQISNIKFLRKTPVSLFVPLDDPEANSFMRDGVSGNLSPEEKKKKLEQQLQLSKEYLNKMFGEGMPNTATTISDYEPQQSFVDMAQGDSDMEIAGLRPDGTQGFNKLGDEVYDPATKKTYKLVPRKGYGYNQWVPVEKARGGGDTMVAHHELEGEVIVEKKRLKSPKDLADKIPGYYDGKPAPLGFPIVEPPKMKNGMHPDLVDGKKVASRFNRLDPVSAKAMPKTGNPHIDKKVKAAAKKPK